MDSVILTSLTLIGATSETPNAAVRTADAVLSDEAATDADAPGAAPPADPTADLLRQVLAEERPDAFDPDEFNRRYGPQAGRSPLPANDGATR